MNITYLKAPIGSEVKAKISILSRDKDKIIEGKVTSKSFDNYNGWVIGVTDKNGKEHNFHQTFVTDVFSYPKDIKRKFNIFSGHKSVTNDKNYLVSSFGVLLQFFLCDINDLIITRIDVGKAMKLWKKQRYIGRQFHKYNDNIVVKKGHFFVVKKKPFKKWVLRNYRKFLIKIKDGYEEEKRYHQELMNEFNQELMNEFYQFDLFEDNF